jgi:predicted nucleic acid-binding protein
MFNFYFDENPVNEIKKQNARGLFEKIKEGEYIPYTSIYVLNEINQNKNEEERQKMISLVGQFEIVILDTNAMVEQLAAIYVERQVIPLKYAPDALHIATTTVFELDYIVSYNFEHIVKNKTVAMVADINFRQNYKAIGIVSLGG